MVQRVNNNSIKSVTTSQRSNAAVVLYRYDNEDIVKIAASNASNTSLSGGSDSATGNLETKRRMVIDNDVVRVNITKNKGSSSGNFSVTLKRGKQESGQVAPSTPDINYLASISVGDWIMIYLKKQGQIDVNSTTVESGLKMIGIVENVRYVEVDDPNTGKPRLEYIITGRDFGKVFDMNVFFNPSFQSSTIATVLGANFNASQTEAVGQGGKKANTEQTPDNIMKRLVDFYLGGKLDQATRTNQNWYIPKELAFTMGFPSRAKSQGFSFVDILDTDKIGLHKYSSQSLDSEPDIEPLLGETVIASLPSKGTVWSILQYMSNSVVNEMYTELTPKNGKLVPSLVCRQLPYSSKPGPKFISGLSINPYDKNAEYAGGFAKDDLSPNEKSYFTDLPRLIISSSDVKEKNVGKSDFERINHIIVTPRIMNQETIDALFASVINVPSIQRYGLKTLQATTQYGLTLNSSESENISKYCEKLLQLLIDWFFLSHNYYNGTLVIDGVDEYIGLGINLYIQDELSSNNQKRTNQLYHIEGYTHTYSQSNNGRIDYRTELRVIRGHTFDGRFSKFFDEKANAESISITTSVLENIRNNS